MHFPGYSAEAAKLLVEERHVKGLGIDTLSIDYGLSKDFAVHHIVNGAGCYGLENIARLEELPPRGFYVVAAPIKIETGSGGPTRLFAVLKK
jgi:kynurenine formamidase